MYWLFIALICMVVGVTAHHLGLVEVDINFNTKNYIIDMAKSKSKSVKEIEPTKESKPVVIVRISKKYKPIPKFNGK